MNTVSKLILVVLTVVSACKNTSKQQPLPVREIDKVKLADLNDQLVSLDQYKGKTVFINFWATWCRPCLEEMPSIQKAMQVLKDENIEFLFASEETKDEIEQFRTGHDYNFNYVKTGSLAALNIMGLPTTFIFNPDGKLVFSEMGYRKWDDQSNIDLIQSISKPR